MKRVIKLFCLIIGVFITMITTVSCSLRSFDLDAVIAVVARNPGSGTRSAFMGFLDMNEDDHMLNVTFAQNASDLRNSVGRNPQAISYGSFSEIPENVTKLYINGVAPTTENIENNSYALARPFKILYLQETMENLLYVYFYDFLMSRQAGEIITRPQFSLIHSVEDAKEFTPISGLRGTINITGSTSVTPVMTALGEKFSDFHPGVVVNVGGTGSGQGYSSVVNKTAAFGMISDVFDPNRIISNQTASEAGIVYSTVAKDAIAVVVNQGNTITNLTVDQLRSIFTGELTRWSTVLPLGENIYGFSL